MKFVCNGLTLSEAVTKVSKACSIRTTAPIMECIEFTAVQEGVYLLATDGELSIRKFVTADVFEEGKICVPGKLFADFSSKLAGEEVSIATCEKGIEIKYRDSASTMQALSADDFPNINLEIGENSFVMKQGELKRIIAETSFCCAQDDSRPVLKGCKFDFSDKLEALALDGYRLALSTADVVAKSGSDAIICPARALSEIAKILTADEEEITLFTQGSMLLVRSEGMTIVTRLYQGEFIRKEAVIPTAFALKAIFDRNELIASAERAAILNRGDKNNLVTLDISAGGVKITSASEYGNVSETLSARTEGPDLSISMNAKFLLEALRALDEEKVEISFNGAYSPFILQNAEQKRSLYLILPVRNLS